jgi:hypothetical protein
VAYDLRRKAIAVINRIADIRHTRAYPATHSKFVKLTVPSQLLTYIRLAENYDGNPGLLPNGAFANAFALQQESRSPLRESMAAIPVVESVR